MDYISSGSPLNADYSRSLSYFTELWTVQTQWPKYACVRNIIGRVHDITPYFVSISNIHTSGLYKDTSKPYVT